MANRSPVRRWWATSHSAWPRSCAFGFRGWFWLAVVVVTTIQYVGDADGHIYFWIADDNTDPNNIGAPLIMDIIGPTVAMILYALSWQRGGDARPEPASPAVRQPA